MGYIPHPYRRWYIRPLYHAACLFWWLRLHVGYRLHAALWRIPLWLLFRGGVNQKQDRAFVRDGDRTVLWIAKDMWFAAHFWACTFYVVRQFDPFYLFKRLPIKLFSEYTAEDWKKHEQRQDVVNSVLWRQEEKHRVGIDA